MQLFTHVLQEGSLVWAGNAGNVLPATVGKRSRHASRHVRDACAVMHAEIALVPMK